MAVEAPKELNETAKPVFGPSLTRAMFESRWTARIQETEEKHDIDKEPTAHPDDVKEATIWEVNKTVDLIPVLLCCHREATSLNLLDPEARATGVLEKMRDLQGAMMSVVKLWRECRNSQPLARLVRWQELPLALRRKINTIMEEMAAAQEKGE